MMITKKTSSLEKNVQAYKAAQKHIAAFKSKHARVFEELEALQTASEAMEVAIKDEARKRAVEGKPQRLVDEPDVYVEVVIPMKAATFDIRKARSLWPKEVMQKVLVIDQGAVQDALKAEELTDEMVEQASNPREAMKARVTLKVDVK